ncbi:hypothetical protein ABPG75_000461 [Micractinium tetrahymenae]
MLQGPIGSVAEAVVLALVGTLTWVQLRRWQTRSAATAGAATGAAANKSDAAAGPVDIQATAHAIVDAAEEEAQQGVHAAGSSSALPDMGIARQDGEGGAGSGGEEAEQEGSAGWIDKAGHAIVDAAEDEAKRKVHMVGSSVNIPDMSANLKAKVTVSEEQQSNPALLAAVYDDMAEKFVQHGLNLPAVEAMRQYFSNLEGPGEPEPLEYDAFPVPLPPGAVRLGVIFFQECNAKLAELVQQAAQEVLSVLPEGCRAHANKPSHYHITVYMASQPHTLRPDPFNPKDGGLKVDGSPQEQAESARPNPETLAREVAAFRAAAASTAGPELEVHRLLMADSGTLLLCSVDRSGHLAKLRKKLRQAFMGGPPKQPTIVHASIARLLSAEQLSREQIDRIQAVCNKWSERLRCMRFSLERCYHIQENTFTTVEGPRVLLPFKRNGGKSAAA